ncbi:hypothetical protein U8V72_19745, partial [Priestia filamentosa]|uniref:hypothetical protein n=1 Tax=Priestia filamentosa TaxID=1402861 RepID=UPI00397DA606
EVKKKDKEGNRYLIQIRFNEDEKQFKVSDVGYTPKGKRKVTWIGSSLTDDYNWRRLNFEDRRKAQLEEILKYISKELLMEALVEVWEQTKPRELIF